MQSSEEKNDKYVLWQVQVTRTLDDLLSKAIATDTHSTKSEFIREAVREKLEKMGIKFKLQEEGLCQ